ncbi:MAG TPA: four helix bundle protein [Thermoanaerobaculia bacterium]
MKSARFNRVFAWQKAHKFVLATYRFSSSFPATERYGLTTQLRRAAVSIPANFVEGFRRSSLAEKVRFYNIAQASGEEARYYLILAADLGYGDPASISAILDEALSLLEGYTCALRKKLEKQNLHREVTGAMK